MLLNFKIPSLIGLVFILTSCSGNQAGPCDYNTYEGLLRIAKLDTLKDNSVKVLVKFQNSSLSDELQDLGQLINKPIDEAFVSRNGLKKGVKLNYTISEVKKGETCTSPIISIHYNLE